MSSALLFGCATSQSPSGDGKTAAHQVMAEAFRDPIPAEPIPLPPLDPPTRLQSQIEAMPHQELARWILPAADAQRVASTAFHRNRMSGLGGISLLLAPQRTAMPGLCELRGWTAFLGVPNESSLSYQQHLDPPLRPSGYMPTILWKVIGSTRSASNMADCLPSSPGEGWFGAPSAETAFRAVNIVEQAQQRPGGFRIICNQMRSADVGQESAFPRCPNATALLKQLTPNLIKRVQRAECTGETGTSPRGCLMIEYHDPASPGTHSFYAVKMVDEPRPRAVVITQGMLPPH